MSKVIVDKNQAGKVVVVATGSSGPAGPTGATGATGATGPAGGGDNPVDNASTGTINDVATTTATSIRFSGAAPVVTGFDGGTNGRRMVVMATGGPLVLRHEDAGSVAANRITTQISGNVLVPDECSVTLIYDGTTQRWRPVLNRDEVAPITNASTGTLNDVVTTSSGSPATGIRFTGAAPAVTGLASGTSGRALYLTATGGDVTLNNENAGSTAANRIITGTGASATITDEKVATLVYDGTSSRWRLTSIGVTASTITGTDTQVMFFDGANNPAGEAGLTYAKASDTLTAVGGMTCSGFIADSTDVNFRVPIAGSAVHTTPLRLKTATINVGGAGGNVTATASQYECPILHITNLGATTYLFLPATEGSTFNIVNDDLQVLNVTRSGGTGVFIGDSATAERRFVIFNAITTEYDFMDRPI